MRFKNGDKVRLINGLFPGEMRVESYSSTGGVICSYPWIEEGVKIEVRTAFKEEKIEKCL